MGAGVIILIIVGVILLASMIRILREYERGVIFRLGRVIGVKGPGLILLIPIIDKLQKVSLRVNVMDVPPQDIITKDNVSVTVNAVVYFRVVTPLDSIVEVENYISATSQIAQTTLRAVLGASELDELLSSRQKINDQLQGIIDEETDPWGVKVSSVEVKHVDLPEKMKRAMAAQAEAERERRAKIINAQGEFQAAQRLADAAKVISKFPAALQLRYLQTLGEIAAENNSTTVFPVPIKLMKAFSMGEEGDIDLDVDMDDSVKEREVQKSDEELKQQAEEQLEKEEFDQDIDIEE